MENTATDNQEVDVDVSSTSRNPRSPEAGAGDQVKLNFYCWKHILDYVPIDQVVRAERVCKEWQITVLQYLQDTRLRIKGSSGFYNYDETRGRKCRILPLTDGEIDGVFETVTRKLGPSIVASYCHRKTTLISILRNCPKLEHLALFGSIDRENQEHSLFWTKTINDLNFNTLKQISLQYSDNTDECIQKLLTSDKLEEIIFYSNRKITGRCLTELKSAKLDSLWIISCDNLELQHLLSSAHSFNSLTKLFLTELPVRIYQKIHLLLNATPHLEDLTLRLKSDRVIEFNNVWKREIADSFGRLGSLRHLCLAHNPTITDLVINAVGRGCRQLKRLTVYEKSGLVTATAIVELCRDIGPSLEFLDVCIRRITEEHAQSCVDFCPRLEIEWSTLTSASDIDGRRPYAMPMTRRLYGKDHPSRSVDRLSDKMQHLG